MKIPQDFWAKGVDKSKNILETILNKIKFFEEVSETSWIDFVKENFAIQNLQAEGKCIRKYQFQNDILFVSGNTIIDEKNGLTIKLNDGSLCSLDLDLTKSGGNKKKVNNIESETELKFTCEEEEALYSIGFQKVNDNCKEEQALQNIAVDWGICLQTYYPWQQVLHQKICILKNDNTNDLHQDFLACYCQTDQRGNVINRGYCVTKIECIIKDPNLASKYLRSDSSSLQLDVRQSCLNNINYFLEANSRDKDWLTQAKTNDKLRVLPPHHPESPCYHHNFVGHFDIGQLDFVELRNGRMEVLTPFLLPDLPGVSVVHVINGEEHLIQKRHDNNDDNEEDDDDDEIEDLNSGMCVNIPDQTRNRMDKLSFFFEERILANVAIWAPGIIFVYLTFDASEKGKMMRMIIWLTQLMIIAVGFYNTLVSFLPERTFTKDLSALEDFRKAQMYMFSACFGLAPVFCISSSQVTEHFLKTSLVSFIPDIAFWKVTQVMYTEERFDAYKNLLTLWFLLILIYTIYKMWMYFEALFTGFLQYSTCPEVKRSNSNSKKKKDTKKLNCKQVNEEITNIASVPVTKSPVPKKRNNKSKKAKKEQTFTILNCQYNCQGVVNIGYVSVNCTETCFNQYHLQCWETFLKIQQVDHEASLLGNSCLSDACGGRIFEIVWVDKFGIETSRKYVYADLNTVQQTAKQKGKGKQKNKLARSLSDTSGSSERTNESRSLSKNIHPQSTTSSASQGPLRHSKSLDAREDENPSLLTQGIQNCRRISRSYASMVKNINNNNNSDEDFERIYVNPPPTSANNSEILEEILELNCPEYFTQNSKLPEKSKILSLIEKSKQPQSFGLLGRSTSMPSSSALIFVPGTNAVIKQPVQEAKSKLNKNPSNNLNISSVEERNSPGSKEDFDPNVSPFSKIMAKHFPNFSLMEVDQAVKAVSDTIKLEELTIPIFRKMISDKLFKVEQISDNEIYMSDDEDDEDGDDEASNKSDTDECLICTELLKDDVVNLEPCGHIFHHLCIKEWLNKDLTCPKCRAVVVSIK